MIINNIHIRNFRCFEKLAIELHPKMNILIGDNASGKTAILDLLALCLSQLHQEQLGLKNTESKDNRKIRFDKTEEQSPFPIFARVNGKLNFIQTPQKETAFIFGFARDINNTTDFPNSPAYKINQILSSPNQESIILPIVAYYDTSRCPSDERVTIKDELFFKAGSRTVAYTRALDKRVIDMSQIALYIKTMEYWEYRHKQQSSELNIIKKAMQNCIPNCTGIFFEPDFGELYLSFENGERKPINFLSNGYRNVLAFIADLAYRCAVLNPYSSDILGETNGVVLIDELDLHLHPTWQERIIKDLKDTFPNIQFIVTTHSPLIIASADKGEVLNLSEVKDNKLAPSEQSYKGWKLDFILEDVMDFVKENVEINPILDKLETAFDKQDEAMYDQALAELAEIVHPNDSLVTVYTLKKARMKLKA